MDTYDLLILGAFLRSLLWIGIIVTTYFIVDQYIKENDDRRPILRAFQGLVVVLVLVLVYNFTIQLVALGE